MSFAFWARWLAWLAAETTALVAGAALLHLWLRSPRAGRTIWRAALASVALVWIVELSGLRERMPGRGLPPHGLVITATLSAPSAPAMTPPPAWPRRAAADRVNGGEGSEQMAGPLPLWIWLGGSLLWLARCGLARVGLAQRRRAAAPADKNSLGLIALWQTSFGLRRVQAQVWDGLRGPVAFGVFRPTVAMPPDFTARFSRPEREAMLAHEMAHLAACDPFWWMASDAIIALAWWHPLVWWARGQLQSAHEAAADEASALMPGGARTLAECLVRLGRELTASDAGRALGIGGNGPRSQLAARVERLLREPPAWQPMSTWARWTPQVSAIFLSLASALLPIQTGLSGSILAMLASAAPARAESPQNSLVVASTNHAPAAALSAPFTEPGPVTPPVRALAPPANLPEVFAPGGSARPAPMPSVSALARLSPAGPSTLPLAETGHFVPVSRLAPPDGSAHPPPEVSLLVRFVSLPETVSQGLGLDWVFGQEPSNNPAVEISHDWGFGVEPVDVSALQTNHGWTARPKSSLAHPTNLVIDRLRAEGQSAILKPEQLAALLNRIEIQGEADILTAPTAAVDSGLQAHVAAQDLMTCVTGVQVTNGSAGQGAGVNYTTDNVALGIEADIIPKLEDNGTWRLRVRASDTSFIGYDNPAEASHKASSSVPGGKPIGYAVPHPHFRALEADAEETVLLGQTLALRGPLWAETTKTKAHFLVPAKTKTVRQRLYIFVTPTLPAPPQTKNK